MNDYDRRMRAKEALKVGDEVTLHSHGSARFNVERLGDDTGTLRVVSVKQPGHSIYVEMWQINEVYPS